MSLVNKSILITGGTGSFGQTFARLALDKRASRVCIYSRDELKQWEMSQTIQDDRLRFFLGDVRDKSRLLRALHGVDIVVHAAALKQVPAAEYNPIEVIKTNVMGSQNVVECAIDANVQTAALISTDKAVEPINLYGATKLCAEKLFLGAHHYTGDRRTKFRVFRYGNVLGSRGSVLPLFLSQMREDKPFTITHPDMTRFLITLKQATEFVGERMGTDGKYVMIPNMPSIKIVHLAKALDPDRELIITGIRPGEKIHEVLSVDPRWESGSNRHFLSVPEISALLQSEGYVIP